MKVRIKRKVKTRMKRKVKTKMKRKARMEMKRKVKMKVRIKRKIVMMKGRAWDAAATGLKVGMATLLRLTTR